MLNYFNDPAPRAGRVIPLVDGTRYFTDVFALMDGMSAGDRLYIMNWYIDSDFSHFSTFGAPLDTHTRLITKLVDLVDKGVDVRVLVWMNTNFFRPDYDVQTLADRLLGERLADQTIASLRAHFGDTAVDDALMSNGLQELVRSFGFHDQQLDTAKTVRDWRQRPGMANRITVNTLDAPTGGCHAKFALGLTQTDGGYTGVGYTGGLDFAFGRHGEKLHKHYDDDWHDLQARIEGPEIVDDLTDFFVEMWNETIFRRDRELASSNAHRSVIRMGRDDNMTFVCVTDAATAIDRAEITMAPSAQTWPHRVLSLRTVPNIYPPEVTPFIGEPELSFAPDGVFEFRDALRHAIAQAEHYIYIEDQGMQSLEVFEWLREALETKPNLRIILLTGARDPADPPTQHVDRTLLSWWFFNRLSDSARERFLFLAITSYVVHSKAYLIDDVVAVIGSAGMFTRSLSQEIEHAVIFGSESGDTTVKELRTDLWSELLGINSADFETAFPSMAAAIAIFDRSAVSDATLHTLACNARHEGQTSMLSPDGFLAALDAFGAPLARSLTPAEINNLRNLEVPPADAVTVASTAYFGRSFDWAPVIFRLAVVEVSYMRWTIGPASDQSPDPTPGAAPSVIQSDRITDLRLGNRAEIAFAPDRPPLRFIGDLAQAKAMIRVTGGAQTSQVRRILTHVGDTITFEPLAATPDANFAYDLRLPAVHEVDLAEYSDASAFGDDKAGLLFAVSEHMLKHELPFMALFNPTQVLADPQRLTRWSLPMPVAARVAVNEPVTLLTIAPPTETITWQCDEPDANLSTGSGNTFVVRFSTSGTKTVYARHTLSPGPPVVYTFQINVLINSGPSWISKFAPSSDLADLAEPFRSRVQRFVSALDAAQVNYQIKSTKRPKQRAFLMAWCYRIARLNRDPSTVDEVLDDVPISWVHYAVDGTPDLETSRAAAEAMVIAYDIGPTGASERSHHITGNAIDIKITLGAQAVATAGGHRVVINTQKKLTMVGRSYKIRRLKQSNHWSMNGH